MTNGSILLVEDEQIVASDLKMTLEQLGYTVPVICKSGEEALAVVPEIMPDMALVDIILAGQMDGIETAEQIRKKYDIPFIYLTAHTDQNTIERAKITEPFGYIIKPFNEKELQSTLTMAFYKSKMDKRLQESERKYRTLIENTVDVIYSFDNTGLVTYISPQIEKYGFKPEEVVGRSLFDFVFPEDLENIQKDLARTLEEGEEFPSILRILDKKGEIHWIEERGKILKDADGNINGITGVLRDITQQKMAEKALGESQTQFRAIVNGASDGLVFVAQNNIILEVNPAFSKITGIPRERAIGELFTRLISQHASQNKMPDYFKLVTKIFEGESLAPIEIDFNDKVLELRTPAEEFPGGHTVILRDVTERKQAEEAIKESESLFRKLFNNHAAVKLIIDPDTGNILDANEAAANYYGWPLERIKQMKIQEINTLPPDEVKKAVDTVKSKERDHFEFRHRRADGSIRDVDVFSSKIEVKGKEILHSIVHDITDRKEAEEALENERGLLRMLINNLPDHIYIKDNESRFLIGNPAVAHHMGADSTDALIGKGDWDFYPNKLAAQFKAEEQAILQSGQAVIDYEESNVDAEGNRKWILTTKLPFRDNYGKIIGLLGIGHDITERKRAEENLENERRLLRMLIDNLPNYVYIKDNNSRFLIGNPAVAHHMGANSPDALVGKGDWDFYPKKPAAQFQAEEQAILESGQALINREEPIFNAEGNLKWILTTKLPLRDNHGKIIGLVGIGHDITERKQAQEALQNERNLLRTLIDNLPHAIYIKDRDGRKLAANSADLKAMNCSSEKEIIGKTDLEIFNNESGKRGYDEDISVIKTGQLLLNHEESFLDEKGETHWRITSKIPLFNDQKEITGLIGFGRDITEQKNMEDALRQNEAQLANAVSLARLGPWEYDVAKGLFTFNDQFYAIFKTTAEDAGGYIMSPAEYIERFVHPEDREFVTAKMQHTIGTTDSNYIENLEHRIIYADGNVGYITVRISIVKDRQGRTVKTYGVNQDITERKQAEEALSQKTALLEAQLNSSIEGVLVVDSEGKKILQNRRTIELWKIPKEIADNPDDRVQVDHVMHMTRYPDQFVSQIKYLYSHPDETSRDEVELVDGTILDRYSAPVIGRDGRNYGRIWSFHDITERKRIELELLKHEQQLEEAQRIGRIGSWEWDPASNNATCSNELYELLDVDQNLSKFTVEVFLNTPHPDDRAMVQGIVIRSIETHQPTDFHFRMITKSGELRWLHAKSSVSVDENGKLKKISGTLQDVTESKIAEETIKHAHADLKNLHDNLDEAIFSIDPVQDKMLQVSVAHETIFGYPVAKFYENPRLWYECMLPEDRPVVDAGDPVLMSGKSLRNEIRIRRSDGQIRWIEAKIKPTLDADGKLIHIDGIVSDITERKTSEIALNTATEELEKYVFELEQFAYISSHDLQEPVRQIVSFSQLLEKKYAGRFGQEADDYVNFVHEGALRMQTLINDMRNYYHLLSDKTPFKKLSLSQIVMKTMQELKKQIRESGVKVTRSRLPEIQGYPKQLNLLFLHLLDNAIKFRGSEPPRIQISCKRQSKGWLFSVQDNGIGIDPAYFDQIFRIFKKLHTRDVYSGSGIGLTICKKVVEHHGGRIWIESQPGKGTTVFFTLHEVE